jgi:hypothetical protein
MAVAVGLAFFLGCARPSAQTEQQKAIVSPVTPVPAIVADQAAPGVPDPTAPNADADTNAPAIIERIPPNTRPDAVATTSGIAEVAKLAQAGVNEQVMLAFVDKYNGRFEVGADQIVYLNDLGVSSTIITAMLKHDDAKGPAVAAQAPPPEAAPAAVPPPNPPTTSVAPSPAASTEVSYFYDSLSPYGSWIYIAGYGWCWQPTVAVSVSTWRPYCDNGSWYWSDGGWYWNSDYSWGWAAFHYGRWYHHGRAGWVWTPGTVWGPSWVSWRYQNGYCGWAPLPPEAHFVRGSGFTYYGRHVSVGFEFGLSAFHYSFVRSDRFCDPHPYRHVVARPTVVNIYRNTTVVNNYVVNNNTVINRGVGRETIARSNGGAPVREVAVRERPMNEFNARHGQSIQREGRQLVAYRPQLPQTPPTPRTAPNAGRGHLGETAGGRGTGGGGGRVTPDTTPRSQPNVGNRGSTEVSRGTPRTGATPSNPNVGGQQNAPRNNERITTLNPGRSQPPQSVTRRDDSLFGRSGTERNLPRNNTPPVEMLPRNGSQKLPPAATVAPRNPNPPLATTHQPAPRVEQQNNNAAYGRVAPSTPYQSPRQYEQTPRRVETAPSGGAIQQSRGSGGQERSIPSGGGGHGNSGGGRSERGERNR